MAPETRRNLRVSDPMSPSFGDDGWRRWLCARRPFRQPHGRLISYPLDGFGLAGAGDGLTSAGQHAAGYPQLSLIDIKR
jgi:hypothetical protein